MKTYSEIKTKIAELESENEVLASENKIDTLLLEKIVMLSMIAGDNEEDVMTEWRVNHYLAEIDETFKNEKTPYLDQAMIEVSKFLLS